MATEFNADEFAEAVLRGSRKVDDATDDAVKQRRKEADAIRDHAATLSRATSSLQSLLTAGDSTFGSATRKIANAATGFAEVIGSLSKDIKFKAVVELVKTGFNVAGSAAALFASTLDESIGIYKALSTVGATSAAGITGLNAQVNMSGMSLKGFQTTVTQNAQALAAFKGSTYAGVAAFSEIANKLNTTAVGDQLRNLGLDADSMGQTAADFIARQTRLGLVQGKVTADLVQGTIEYAKELDTLSKLTGLNNAELKKEQDRILSESRFRAHVEGVRAREGDAAANGLLNTATAMKALGPQLQKGWMDTRSGLINTAEAGMFVRTVGTDAGNESGRLAKAGQTGDAMKTVQAGLTPNLENIRMQAEIQGINDVYGNFSELIDASTRQINADGSIVKKETDKQANTQDELTTKVSSTTREFDILNISLRKLSQVSSLLVTQLGSIGALGLTKSTDTARKVAQPAADLATGAISRLEKVPSMIGNAYDKLTGKKSAPGAKASATGGAGGATTPGGSSGPNPADILDFTSGGGAADRFSMLQEGVRASLLQAGTSYQQQTGQKLKILSMFRTADEQAKLYKAYIEGRGPLAAAPGTSQHESGQAVDIGNWGSSGATEALNAAGLFQLPNGTDKPHFSAIGGADIPVGTNPKVQLHEKEIVLPAKLADSVREMSSGGNEAVVMSQAEMISYLNSIDRGIKTLITYHS